MAKKKKKFKSKNMYIFIIFIVLFVLGISCTFNNEKFKIKSIKIVDTKEIEKEKAQKENEYNACLAQGVREEEKALLADKVSEIDSFIANNHYEASVFYEDLSTGFQYKYNEDVVYYGCSLIKIVDALYLINQAINGEVNLDTETVKYTSNYKMAYSSGMAERSIGEQVSLRDLLTYAISVSDNSAHLMLLDYIGFSTLKAYGQSLGAKVILTGGDNFGNQTAEDTNIYLKEAYRIIKENEEYGSFLKKIMDNNERNAFNTEDVHIYHKYGSYGSNYHDIGLNLDDPHPYAISILTLHENRNYEEVVQNIHAKIRELHNEFYLQRENFCHSKIYE